MFLANDAGPPDAAAPHPLQRAGAVAMTGATVVHVWTLRVDCLDEARVAPWLPVLDATERGRAARFVFARHRVLFVAAHALLRTALARFGGEPAAAWSFVADAHGKPSACLGPRSAPRLAPLSFNLSHTEGMAGVAVIAQPGVDIGFDLEPIARNVELAVAGRYFAGPEVAWLDRLAPATRPPGFLRLWTLKEAFIKAIGKGLTQDLSSFWFDPCPPQIHFTPRLAEREADWWFEQRVVDGGFFAALGLRRPENTAIETRWVSVKPADINAGPGLPDDGEPGAARNG